MYIYIYGNEQDNLLVLLVRLIFCFNRLTCSEKECKRQAKLIQGQEAEINQLRNEIEDLKQTLIEIESKKECAEKRADRFEETYRKARNEQVIEVFWHICT